MDIRVKEGLHTSFTYFYIHTWWISFLAGPAAIA